MNITRSLLALTLFFCLVACGSDSGSGSREAPDKRIVNGIAIGQEELPFVKRLALTVPGIGSGVVCSGAFISPNHFLTAAHCIISPQIELGPQPTEAFSVEIEPGVFVPAAGIAVHPGYSGETPSAEFPGLTYFPADIAIVLTATPYTGPVVPVSSRAPFPGQVSVIAGYGRTSTEVPADGVLRVGGVFIDAVGISEGTLYSIFDRVDESGVCSGDSGGPQVVQFSPDEPFVLVGVISAFFGQCEAPTLNLSALVPTHLEFIGLVTGGAHSSF